MSCLVVLAAVLRWRSIFTDFWLDEIWSYEEFAKRARSIADVFLNPAFKHDNNQYLNTVFLYLLGRQSTWAVYRVPALVAGLLTIAVATWIGAQRSRADAWISGGLVAGSFLMVVYSTEARGYAWLLLFALLAYLALRRYLALEAPSFGAAIPFSIWMALGLTAHATMFHLYLGALLWSGYRLRARLGDFLRLHVVSTSFSALWVLFVLRGSRVGGGPPWRWQEIADQSLAWTLGYPTALIPAAVAVAVAAGLVVWDAWRLWREGLDEGLFTMAVILGPPALAAAISPPWLFPRYFLISLLFLLLVLARLVGRLWQRGRWSRVTVMVLLAVFALGNVRHIVPFSEYGRGEASQAVRTLVAETGAGSVTVSSLPVELRTQLPVRFYSDVFGLQARIQYVPEQNVVQAGSPRIDWVIATSPFPCDSPMSQVTLPTAGVFELQRAYRAYGPSGICWSVYRHLDSGRR